MLILRKTARPACHMAHFVFRPFADAYTRASRFARGQRSIYLNQSTKMELFCNLKSIICRHISRNFLPGYQGGIVQFIVSDEADGKFYADISENIRFLDGVCEAPDAVVEMSAAVFRMLIGQPYATLEDTVKVTGNRALVSLIAHAAQPEADSGRTRLRDLTLQVTNLASPETEVHRMATIDARQLMQILHGGTPVILTAMLNASGWRTTFDELQQRFGDLPARWTGCRYSWGHAGPVDLGGVDRCHFGWRRVRRLQRRVLTARAHA
ncbi:MULTISPECIES: hypothetical protein [Burkholderia]|uniref:hypothetical protein n=1 Tax=Burkholderia TaxID=32008 RepID=UPI000B2F7EB2|nr:MULTISPECIES: hypothetical protein [Burkholderia]